MSASSTNSIRVNFKNSTSSKVVISVAANNLCGASQPRSLTINVNTACRTVADEEVEPVASILEEKVNLYPNPASKEVNFEFSTMEKGEYTLSIFDVLGKKVYQDRIDVKEDIYKKTIDIMDLRKGIYFVKIENQGAFSRTIKLVVEK